LGHIGSILHSALVGPGEPNILTNVNPNPIVTGFTNTISSFISSGQSTQQLININRALENRLTDTQVLGGFADASTAINNLFDGLRAQTQINEQQRAVNNTFTKELNSQLGFTIDPTGGPIDLTKLGQGGGFFDAIKGNIGTTGLLIGAGLLALLVLKK